jgi:hypothetical protein
VTAFNALPDGHRLAGRFVVRSVLGHGRSSTVYKALDVHTRTEVALKVLDPFLAQDATSVERFAREVSIIRSVQHPNVVKVYSFERDGDFSLICMEYIEGVDGKTYVARQGPMGAAELLSVAKCITAAVGACHRVKVLHRDLKPHNVLLGTPARPSSDSFSLVKVVDFGISKMNSMSDLTKTGTIIGTPEYMAPELFRSTRADPRSDIYGLGAVLYEFLTGQPPFTASSLSAVMTRQLRNEIDPISTFRGDVPAWLEAIVLKCLRTDLNSRYQSCYELLADLDRGERALAAAEEPNEGPRCLNCKGELIAGLAFCPNCGKLGADVYEKGRHSLILYKCDDPEGLHRYLTRNFPAGGNSSLKSKLADPPALIFRGVSEETAHSVGNELAAIPCDLRVTDKLASEFKLPTVHLAAALLPVCAIYVGRELLPWPARAGIVLLCEVLVVLLYLRRVRPLLNLRKLRDAAASRPNDLVVRLVAKLKQLNDTNLKTILGHVARSLLRIHDKIDRSSTIFDAAAIARIVFAAFDAAASVERYEIYLASRSLNEIKDKLDTVELRLGQAQDTPETERLVGAKVDLAREFRRYQEIEDLHARTYTALLNLNVVLQRIDSATGTDDEAPEMAATLRELQDDFSSGAATPGADGFPRARE